MKQLVRTRFPVSVSTAVYISNDKGWLLLLQQARGSNKGKWGPPAGGMDAHENPLETATKKAKKEIGVDVSLENLIGVYTIDRGDTATGVGFAFRGKLKTKNIAIKKGEITAYKYFSAEEVKALIKDKQIYKPEYFSPVFRDWLKGISYPLELIKTIISGV